MAQANKTPEQLANEKFQKFCQQIIEDDGFQNKLKQQAREGQLDTNILKMVVAYAAGLPTKRIVMDLNERIDLSELDEEKTLEALIKIRKERAKRTAKELAN